MSWIEESVAELRRQNQLLTDLLATPKPQNGAWTLAVGSCIRAMAMATHADIVARPTPPMPGSVLQ